MNNYANPYIKLNFLSLLSIFLSHEETPMYIFFAGSMGVKLKSLCENKRSEDVKTKGRKTQKASSKYLTILLY